MDLKDLMRVITLLIETSSYSKWILNEKLGKLLGFKNPIEFD
jgi:hypothetical protein